MSEFTFESFINRRVVLDTQGPLLYIGRLMQAEERGYWLIDADVHDRSDGHSGKEEYINEARQLERSGSRHTNRKRVFVERHAVMSISTLEDVVDAEE